MADTRTSDKGKGEEQSDKRRSRNKNVKAAATGVAIGIGSAALVAALLYSNRPQDDKKNDTPNDPRFEPRES
ncbi:hypothetical protein ACSBM8_14840 [Sphingomonas sp. ASY06-1R]|uniref:hypothetical protein n=1 Tax=Sphingomonas sp. ASY06-1R TaxID=3445771 RepID=UPI003FA28283